MDLIYIYLSTRLSRAMIIYYFYKNKMAAVRRHFDWNVVIL